jgi:hypothetical protein
MKGTDVTPEQLAHAEAFLRATAAPVPVIGAKTMLDVEHLIRLLAWYGAIRRDERIRELVVSLNAAHADYLEARKRGDALEAELVEARTVFLTSSAIQAAAVEEAHKANDAWAEQDQESARNALVLMAERDAALNRLSAMCEHRWQCYGLKRDDGVTFWYVRDRNNRITDGCATPEQAIDSAINRQWEYQPDSLTLVLQEVGTRRASQDTNHGGPEHDDTHTPFEWSEFMRKFIRRAENYAMDQLKVNPAYATEVTGPEWDMYENALFDVAALAVAAIQSSRRKRNV